MQTEHHNPSMPAEQMRRQQLGLPNREELVSVIRGALPLYIDRDDAAVSRNIATAIEMHLEFRGEQPPAPVDWPARFRAAADAAEAELSGGPPFHATAAWLEDAPEYVVEAIGRALLGGQP